MKQKLKSQSSLIGGRFLHCEDLYTVLRDGFKHLSVMYYTDKYWLKPVALLVLARYL